MRVGGRACVQPNCIQREELLSHMIFFSRLAHRSTPVCSQQCPVTKSWRAGCDDGAPSPDASRAQIRVRDLYGNIAIISVIYRLLGGVGPVAPNTIPDQRRIRMYPDILVLLGALARDWPTYGCTGQKHQKTTYGSAIAYVDQIVDANCK